MQHSGSLQVLDTIRDDYASTATNIEEQTQIPVNEQLNSDYDKMSPAFWIFYNNQTYLKLKGILQGLQEYFQSFIDTFDINQTRKSEIGLAVFMRAMQPSLPLVAGIWTICLKNNKLEGDCQIILNQLKNFNKFAEAVFKKLQSVDQNEETQFLDNLAKTDYHLLSIDVVCSLKQLLAVFGVEIDSKLIDAVNLKWNSHKTTHINLSNLHRLEAIMQQTALLQNIDEKAATAKLVKLSQALADLVAGDFVFDPVVCMLISPSVKDFGRVDFAGVDLDSMTMDQIVKMEKNTLAVKDRSLTGGGAYQSDLLVVDKDRLEKMDPQSIDMYVQQVKLLLKIIEKYASAV